MIMLDKWIGGCKVEVHDWIDEKHIYVNVRYFLSGSSINRPAWDKSVLVTDTPKGRRFVFDYTETLVTGVSRMPERKAGSKMPIITVE